MDFIIADNQELTRYAIERLLGGVAEGRLFKAANKAELIERLKEHGQGVVLLDYTLFDFFDVNNLLIVGQRFPNVNWLLLSDDLTETFLRAVVYQSHNISIVFKDATLTELSTAIQAAISGKRYISQRVTEMLLAKQLREAEHPSALTPTEVEILRAIAQGKTTKEIAAERFSSIHTVNTHRKNIFRKLGVNTAHEAIKTAVRSGLIDESEYFI